MVADCKDSTCLISSIRSGVASIKPATLVYWDSLLTSFIRALLVFWETKLHTGLIGK